jgi:hypothetical protein
MSAAAHDPLPLTSGPLEPAEGGAKAAIFLSTLYQVVKEQGEDAAMRMVYAYIHKIRMEDRPEQLVLCDRILEDIDFRRVPPVLLIALLTITAPIKKKLKKRAQFFANAKKAIAEARGSEPAERMLIGLE